MSKLKFEYNIRGYRYAPESFHIYKGLPGQKKKEIPLSDEQRQQMGYLCLTEGVKSAVDYVKHIERERAVSYTHLDVYKRQGRTHRHVL